MSDTELYYAYQLNSWMGMSSDALAMFEYVTTLDQEVSSVWKQKCSGASLLLFAVRYTMLATAISNLFQFTPLNYQECVGYYVTDEILIPFGLLLTAAFSALRVYALCDGNFKLAAVAFLLQLSPVAVNVYSYAGATYALDPSSGCLQNVSYGLKTQTFLFLASRIPLTVGDILVVIVTWIKSFRQLKSQRSLGIHLPLSTILFRDGTVYFLILLTMNALELSPLTPALAGQIIAPMNGIVPLLLVNRFMLNLRQLTNSEMRSTPHIRTISTPMFRMSVNVAGNMGEGLEHGWEAEATGDNEPDIQEAPRDDTFENQELPHRDGEAGLSGRQAE